MTYPSDVLASSPVGYWRLDETSGTAAADSSGGGRNGTYVGSPTLGQAGLITSGTSVLLNGTSQYVTVPHSAALNFTGGIFTVEAWVKPAAIPGAGFAEFVEKGDNWYFGLNIGTLTLEIVDSVGGVVSCQQTTGTAPVVGTTYHVAGTCTGTNVFLYLNGVQVGTIAAPATFATTTTALTIGSYLGSAEFLSGTIDEVAVYPTALSQTTLAAHYTSGLAGASAASMIIPRRAHRGLTMR